MSNQLGAAMYQFGTMHHFTTSVQYLRFILNYHLSSCPCLALPQVYMKKWKSYTWMHEQLCQEAVSCGAHNLEICFLFTSALARVCTPVLFSKQTFDWDWKVLWKVWSLSLSLSAAVSFRSNHWYLILLVVFFLINRHEWYKESHLMRCTCSIINVIDWYICHLYLYL